MTVISSAMPVARPACGAVMGEDRDGVAVFRGIPYGAPCEFERRFLPPAPARHWDGVRDCTRNGPVACQEGGSISGDRNLGAYFSGGQPDKFGVLTEEKSENCLVLNVLTPDISAQAKPVLFYIHGGGFTSGSGSLAIGADMFVREHDIVLVSVNHRLNVFGYLYLGDFDKKYALSGITGILDLVLALKWVRDNIAAFGGDPANVTIMGESGGAMKVNMLMALECAKGLFRRAIVESGSAPAFTVTKEQGTELARMLLARLNIPEDDLSALTKLTASEIMQAASGLGFRPVADGECALYNGAGSFCPTPAAFDVPVMVGASEDELAVFSAPGKKDGANVVNDKNLRDYLLEKSKRATLPSGECELTEDNVDGVIEACRANNPRSDDADHIAMKISSAMSVLGSGAYYQAMEKAAQGGAPVYHYFVTYDAPHPTIPGARYAWHTADLPLQLRIVLHKESEAISRTLSDMVASFARNGKPVSGDLKWPEFTVGGRETMVFDNICRVETDPTWPMRAALGLSD